MSDVERRIRARVEAFVDELTELVREAALEAVRDALGGAPKPAGKAPAPRRSGKARSGGKRSGTELGQLEETIAGHVGSHPGQGAQEIAKALGLSTKELSLPLRKLAGRGVLTTKGQKRATKYFRGKR